MNPKLIPQGLIGTIILLVILSVITTGSPLPWKILSHESIWIKILGWYFVAQIVLLLLGLLALKAIPDKDCPICNRNLKAFIPVYGQPIACPYCGTWFHKNCRLTKQQCPVCYPEVEQEEGFIDLTRRY